MADYLESYLNYSISINVTVDVRHAGSFCCREVNIDSTDGKRVLLMPPSKGFPSEEGAKAYGLMRARAWIDHYKEGSALPTFNSEYGKPSMPADKPIYQKQWLAIQALSAEFGVPIDDMRAMYEEQLAITEAGAKVKDFIPILVQRKIQDVLSHTQTSHRVSPYSAEKSTGPEN